MEIDFKLRENLIDPLSSKKAVKIKDWGYIFVEPFEEKSATNPETKFVLTIPAHSVVTFVDTKDTNMSEEKLLDIFQKQGVEIFPVNDESLPNRAEIIQNNGATMVSNGDLFARVRVSPKLNSPDEVIVLVLMGSVKKLFSSLESGFVKLDL